MAFVKISEQSSLYNDLEKKSVLEILTDINTEDHKVADAVQKAIPQIEKLVTGIVERMKRGGRIWITIFPDKPITEKPAETRMGSGKGSPEYWVAVVKPGRVMFEIAGVDKELAQEAMRLASNKLPIKCKFVTKEELGGEQ